MTAEPVNPTQRFAKLARSWRLSDGGLRVVPVVGTGLNIQAASIEGGKKEDDWNSLLIRTAERGNICRSRLKHLPRSFIQQWEAIVRWYTIDKYGYQPFKGEEDLQKQVCHFVRELENSVGEYSLYRRFASAGFKDILSLNFDRRLALSLNCRSVSSSVTESDSENKLHTRSLFRYSDARERDVRIWYPHGDSKRADTIKLGVRRYGIYIAAINEVRNRYMRHWYDSDEIYQLRGGLHWALPTENWDDIVRSWDFKRSWANVFMSAPLVFVGCGLGEDEWPLWWLLNQRARQSAYLDQPNASHRPETIVLSAGKTGPADRFKGDLCYIENIHFTNHQEMWNAICGELI